MKVAFLQNIEGVAGSEKYFLALIPALIAKGVEVEMVPVIKKSNKDKAQPFIELLEEHKIPFTCIYINSYASLKIPFLVNRHLKKHQFTILHTHLIYADVWTGIVKLFNKKIKAISTKHGYHEETYVAYCNQPASIPKNLYYYLFKFSHKRMDAIYACSVGLKNFYIQANLIQPRDMDVILHGFDYPEIVLNKATKYRFSELQLIITGRLIPRKGHHFILEIMPDLIREFPNLSLVVLGNGELENKLKEQASTLNIDNSVHFLGFQSDVNQYLKSSDLMVVTSYSEGLPLVIFEAFNAKTPVITFDTIGSNELVINDKTGVVVPAFNKKQFTKSIVQLLKNKQLSEQLATQAYQDLKTKFSLERMCKETVEYYKKVLQK